MMTDSRPQAPEIIALFGPTGVGKTAIAIVLAELLRARGEDPVAVSADALQVYAGLEVLTGVASPAERAALEHRLVSFLPLDATFSAGEYAGLAHAEIDALLAGLTMEREALYARIDERVEDMLRRGAREEVRRAQATGISETARRALGFEELLAGDVEAMKRHTRNYAKRQLTWMRKLSGVLVIDVTGRSARSVAGEILDSCAV